MYAPKQVNKPLPSIMSSSQKYGDLVAAFTFTILGMTVVLPDLDPSAHPASPWVAAFHSLAAIVGFSSWYIGTSRHQWLSVATCLANALTIGSMIALNFPVYDDSPLPPMMIWLFVMLNANTDLPSRKHRSW